MTEQTQESRNLSQHKKCGEWALSLWNAMCRRKPLQEQRDQLKRVMRLSDLTFLGVGSTLGVGIYIIAGKEAHDLAGPAIVVSLCLTAFATILAALTFVELASRVASAGSAYEYSYVACGEFPAFVIGWNLLLEYAIGTAGVARAMVEYIDGLSNRQISHFLIEFAPMNVGFFASYVDIASFIIVCLVYILLTIGTAVSSLFTNICTMVNLINIVVMVTAASVLADPHNWNLSKDEIPSDAGAGGFMPYGVEGVAKAAATCFFAYVGFDSIAASGEEAINPRRNIPLSIFFTVLIVCISYTAVATVITMAVPYYDQDVHTPFPTAFQNAGWPVLKWVVAVGTIFALSTSLVGSSYPMPRILYAMASDGMFFRPLSYVHPKNKVPLFAIFICWFITGLMALFLDLEMLIDLLSIGTLLAYAVVGICVVQIRYRCEATELAAANTKRNCNDICRIIFNTSREKNPTCHSNAVVTICQFLFLAISTGMFGVMGWIRPFKQISVFIFIGISAIAIIFLTIIIYLQPQAKPEPGVYAVPLVPVLPYISVLVNLYFMITLDYHTWGRFAVWNVTGLLVYFFYNVKYSSLSNYYQRKRAQEAEIKTDRPPSSTGKSDDQNNVNDELPNIRINK